MYSQVHISFCLNGRLKLNMRQSNLFDFVLWSAGWWIWNLLFTNILVCLSSLGWSDSLKWSVTIIWLFLILPTKNLSWVVWALSVPPGLYVILTPLKLNNWRTWSVGGGEKAIWPGSQKRWEEAGWKGKYNLGLWRHSRTTSLVVRVVGGGDPYGCHSNRSS